MELLLLIMLVTVPVAGLTLYSSFERRADDEAQAQAEALRLAQAYEGHLDSSIRAAGLVLRPIAGLMGIVPSLDDVELSACQGFFAPLGDAEHPNLVGVIHPDGRFLCANTELPEGATMAGFSFLERLPNATGAETAGVEPSPVDGSFTIPVGYPIRNAQGEYTGALVALLGLPSLTPVDILDTLPPGFFATITDSNRRIVARYPQPQTQVIGQPVSNTGLYEQMVAQGSGSMVGRSVDGNQSLIGFVSSDGLGDGAMVFVGINRGSVLSASLNDLWRNSTGFLLITGIALGITWVGTDRLVLRPLLRTREVATRIGDGDLTARVGPEYGHGELGDLGRLLDDMAESIETRTREVNELNSQLERRVMERTAELEAANKELEAFSYSVSHDLRAPLRAVDGFLQIALMEIEDQISEEARHHLSRVEAGSRRMGNLIDDLLQYSRVGRQEVSPREFSMDDLAAECVEDVLAPADRERIAVTIDPLGVTSGERMLIRRVMDNLVGNAMKFSRGAESPMIHIGRCETPEGDTAYFVRDNGVGFDMAYAEKLFGVFQRLHLQEEYEGTGVGLAIVQRIVHKHGGRVWAEATPNEGATFYFTLKASNAA